MAEIEIPSDIELEIRIQVQVVYLGNVSRKHRLGNGQVKEEGRKPTKDMFSKPVTTVGNRELGE